MDINTKQRPVPSELILDIKRMAETETDVEAILRDVFDKFNTEASSPLYGLLSPSEKQPKKISRVTFNQAIKAVWPAFANSEHSSIYSVLAAYLHSWLGGLRGANAEGNITNPTMFKAILLLFPEVAQRVSDRFDDDFSQRNFEKVLSQVFLNTKKADLLKPGVSHRSLYEIFRKALSSGFSLSKITGQ